MKTTRNKLLYGLIALQFLCNAIPMVAALLFLSRVFDIDLEHSYILKNPPRESLVDGYLSFVDIGAEFCKGTVFVAGANAILIILVVINLKRCLKDPASEPESS